MGPAESVIRPKTLEACGLSAVTRLRERAGHGKASGGFRRPEVFFQYLRGRQEDPASVKSCTIPGDFRNSGATQIRTCRRASLMHALPTRSKPGRATLE